MSLQGLHHTWPRRLEPLATYPVRGFPYYSQRLSHSLVVNTLVLGNAPGGRLIASPQESDRVLSVAADNGYELIQYPTLVLLRCLYVPAAYGSEYFESSVARLISPAISCLPPG